MRNKRVFVSGGAGVIGTALVNALIKEGAIVFVGDLKPCPKSWLGKVKYRQGDLTTIVPQDLLAFDPELFFHLAATFERSEESYSFFEENFHHNVKLSHILMAILKKAHSLEKVIFASSYLIYDPQLYQFSSLQEGNAILSETSLIYPRNGCGAAKLFHELELRFLNQFLQENVSFISARIFRVYGRHSRDIISRWIRAALRHENLTVYRPEGRFDYIFADEVAEGLLRLADTHYNGVVNLGSGRARSIQDVLTILHKYFPNLQTEEIPSSLTFENSQADIQLLEKLTNWSPKHTLETVIPQLIQFEKEALTHVNPSVEHSSVLITSISKKMPLIEAVRMAANKIGHFKEIHGCDSYAFCIGQYQVDAFWHCPSLDRLTIEEVISYCQEHQITAIIPTRDADLEFYAGHLSVLRKKGIHVMVSKLEAVLSCLDKKHFADILIRQRFPAIPTFLSISEMDAPRYVVKERKGAGSHHLGLDLSKENAIAHSLHLKEPIFQPYLEGKEWSVDLYRTEEGQIKGCVARQRNYVVEGESQVTTTASFPALEHLCQDIADCLSLYGHVIFQVIEDKQGQFHVIECNPRFGGASTASIAVGLDSFFWFFIESLGQSLQDYPFMRRQGDVRQIRYLTDRIIPWSSYSI